MASLEETLKKLNKGKKVEDTYDVVGDRDINRTRTSTGSPYIDYISGAFMNGAYNCIIAKGGTGKSSVALLACKDTIDRRKKYAVYFDGERTLDDSYFKRMGIDKSKFIHIKHRNLEQMLDEAEAFSKSEDVGIIVIDSIPIFVSTVVEEKSASDNHIGTEAKKFTQRMPIIEGNCANRDICILGLTHYKLNPGVMMGDARTMSRGEWQGTMMNTFLDLTKKSILTDENKKVIGHVLDVRVKKSKGSPYDATKVYSTNFYNDGGFNKFDEYSRVFMEAGIVSVGGAGWVSFGNSDGEEVKIQGADNLSEYLKKNENDFNNLLRILIDG